MDIVDIASDYEALTRERKLTNIQQQTHEPGSEVCLDCGETIPEQRKALVPWAIRCLSCQEQYEKWAKHYR